MRDGPCVKGGRGELRNGGYSNRFLQFNILLL